jgi:hypothetical protein
MSEEEVQQTLNRLTDAGRRVASRHYPGLLTGLELPGLYAWWVDSAGATALSDGLGHTVTEGLIYAGQAGAGMSTRSLQQRLRNHRRGNIRGSTFRRTLAAALQGPLRIEAVTPGKLSVDSEQRLCEWIDARLSLSVYAIQDRGALLVAEAQMLMRLDPPLNLDGMVSTPVRQRLSQLRSELGRRPADRVKAAIPATWAAPATDVASPGAGRLDALAHLAGLIGKTIPTLSGRPNRVLALDGEFVTVATSKSPNGEKVPVAWVQSALDRLVTDGTIDVNVESVGYRSAFIGAVLATVPGAKSSTRPRRVWL